MTFGSTGLPSLTFFVGSPCGIAALTIDHTELVCFQDLLDLRVKDPHGLWMLPKQEPKPLFVRLYQRLRRHVTPSPFGLFRKVRKPVYNE